MKTKNIAMNTNRKVENKQLLSFILSFRIRVSIRDLLLSHPP